MSDPAAVEELMRRVHGYVSRVTNDPTLIQKNRSELQFMVDAWKKLNRMLPRVAAISAEEFEKYLLSQITNNLSERVAFAAQWLQCKPPQSLPTARAATTSSPAASPVFVTPLAPRPGATPAELLAYQQNVAKCNRMFEMYSKIMANAHEMKKSLIANLPR